MFDCDSFLAYSNSSKVNLYFRDSTFLLTALEINIFTAWLGLSSIPKYTIHVDIANASSFN